MQVRQGSFPASEVFLIFFLLLPAFAAVMQLLLLNVQLLVVYFINEPVREGFGVAAALLFIAMELSGLVGAVVIFFCLFPVSLIVAAFATVSYFVVKRVSVVAVVAAVVAAISLEEILAPGLLASYHFRGPYVPAEWVPDATMATFLACLLQLLPALICWAHVRDVRKRP